MRKKKDMQGFNSELGWLSLGPFRLSSDDDKADIHRYQFKEIKGDLMLCDILIWGQKLLFKEITDRT